MTRLTDAYVAGLIDGEGSLSLDRASSGLSWTPRLDIGMTTPAKPLLDQLLHQFGGSISRTRPATERWAEAWAWRLIGADLLEHLSDWLPHLRLKRRQAELLLIAGTVREECVADGNVRATWTEEASQQCAVLAAEIKELNRKGPQEEEEGSWTARLVGGVWMSPQMSLLSAAFWEPFSGRWPRRAGMRSGRVFERPTWEHPTAVTDGSVLPTPTSSDPWTSGLESSQMSDGSKHSLTLPKAVERLMPTPTSRDWKDGSAEACKNVPENGLLGRVVHRLT